LTSLYAPDCHILILKHKEKRKKKERKKERKKENESLRRRAAGLHLMGKTLGTEALQ
jgi:hypothetical protein